MKTKISAVREVNYNITTIMTFQKKLISIHRCCIMMKDRLCQKTVTPNLSHMDAWSWTLGFAFQRPVYPFCVIFGQVGVHRKVSNLCSLQNQSTLNDDFLFHTGKRFGFWPTHQSTPTTSLLELLCYLCSTPPFPFPLRYKLMPTGLDHTSICDDLRVIIVIKENGFLWLALIWLIFKLV